jgi:hypothetical protein
MHRNLLRLATVAIDIPQSTPDLAAVDKSQVFALNLIRRKLAKNPIDLIRCKFSIDGGDPQWNGVRAASTISKPYRLPAETPHSPFASNERLNRTRKPANARSEAAERRALAFA